MGEKVDLGRIRKLRDESPKTVMGWIRLAWPDIRAALDRHVGLRTIHERLNEAGIPITYQRLSFYIGRLRREENKGQTAAPKAEKSVVEIPEPRPDVDQAATPHRDPLGDFRQRTA